MGLFNNKSKSEKALDKFLALLTKYLKKPDVDWSRKLSRELPRLNKSEKHEFLSSYGDGFFANIREACARDERRLNYLPELVRGLIGYTDEDDLTLRRIYAKNMLYVVSQINKRGCTSDHAKLSILMLTKDAMEVDHDAGRNCGFLNKDQRERLVFGLLDRMAQEYQESGEYSYTSTIGKLLPVIQNMHVEEGVDSAHKMIEKILSNTELFDHKCYFECVLTILSAQDQELYAKGRSIIQDYIEGEIQQVSSDDTEGRIALATKIKTLADAGYDLDYQNATVKPRVFMRAQSKSDYSALMVDFNEASSDKAGQVLFVEHTILSSEGVVKINDKSYIKTPRREDVYCTAEMRATLVDHYGAAGEILADKLEESASTKPIKNAKISYIV